MCLEDLEAHYYTHCSLLSRLNVMHLSPNSRNLSSRSIERLETSYIFNIVANKQRTWLFYPDATYHLHLSHLSMSVLAAPVKSCSQPGCVIPQNKTHFISKIIDHFISERNVFFRTSRPKLPQVATPHRDNICAFVSCMEHLYGEVVAGLLPVMVL